MMTTDMAERTWHHSDLGTHWLWVWIMSYLIEMTMGHFMRTMSKSSSFPMSMFNPTTIKTASTAWRLLERQLTPLPDVSQGRIANLTLFRMAWMSVPEMLERPRLWRL